MDSLTAVLAVLTGVAIRLALPVAGTALLVLTLRRLDAQWQREAEALAVEPLEFTKCWQIKNCTPEQREACPAADSDKPCWQVRRLSNGYLREECLDCEVFEQAPVPATS